MATGTIKTNKVTEVATGIEGVSAYKVGRAVFLNIVGVSSLTASSRRWNTIGQLPVELRPISNEFFMAYDNSASARNSLSVAMELLTSGNLEWYSYGSETFVPRGNISYISAI